MSRRGFVILGLGGAGVAAVAGALLLGRLSGGAGSSHGGTTGDNSGSTADSTGSLKTSDGIASKGSSSTGSTSSESSSKVRYYGSTGKLVMSAFDFSVILPSGLSCTSYSDGVTLREGSSDMVIDAWVRPNSQGESLADLRAAAAAGHDLTTNAGKDDWFVVSYWDGDIGYYLREYVSDDTIAALEFYWPRSSADHCSQLIEDMSKTISDDN